MLAGTVTQFIQVVKFSDTLNNNLSRLYYVLVRYTVEPVLSRLHYRVTLTVIFHLSRLTHILQVSYFNYCWVSLKNFRIELSGGQH